MQDIHYGLIMLAALVAMASPGPASREGTNKSSKSQAFREIVN